MILRNVFIINLDIENNKLVDESYKDKTGWAKKSINASAGMGKFSSDRSIQDYAENIWKVKKVPVPTNFQPDSQPDRMD